MPVYEYECPACKFTYERILKVSDRFKYVGVPCPECFTALRLKVSKTNYKISGAPKFTPKEKSTPKSYIRRRGV